MNASKQIVIGSRTVQRIGIVGAGVIGASWAAHFLARGFDVVASDPAPGAEARLRANVAQYWPTMQRIGLQPHASQERLSFSAELDTAMQRVDFVQENGPEREDLKVELLAHIDGLLSSDVIIASSSSGLSTSRMQVRCEHPERVVLGHPFNPPHLIPLVEVIGGNKTSEQTIQQAMAFYASVGKRPIHGRKEIKGHIANRLQAALWREAFHLVEQGVASVEDIDTAISQGPGLRWAVLGPFLNLHLSGGAGGISHVLAHLGGPIEDWWKDLGHPEMTESMKRLVVQGVADVMSGQSSSGLETERDGLLVDLIAAKHASSLR